MQQHKSYNDLTAHFIGQLEQGTRPWSRSWKSSAANVGRPLRGNGIPYRGVNVLALWTHSMLRGFSSPYWMTFLQAKDFGAHVRKGAKSAQVFKVGQVVKEKPGEDPDVFSYLKSYAVFNAEEIEGLPAHFFPAVDAPKPEQGRIAAAEDFARRTGANIRHGGDRAFYARAADLVQMPMFGDFESPDAYYATLFHELTHWTGAPHRVERPKGDRFGDPKYAFEELVAELGAAFICADLRISDTPRPDHASYLANWVEALRAHPRILMQAASHAEKAAEYLHGLQASVPVVLAQAA